MCTLRSRTVGCRAALKWMTVRMRNALVALSLFAYECMEKERGGGGWQVCGLWARDLV